MSSKKHNVSDECAGVSDPRKKTTWKNNSEELARKCRPTTLEGIAGQELAKHTIRGFVKSRKTPGAILLHGPWGNGKTTLARIIARTVNCEHLTKTGDPCGICKSCKAMDGEPKHPDYIEINASASRTIEDARALLRRIQYKPQLGNRLVVVLDEVHEMTPNALEALLKTLEEPKSHVLFILATTNPEKLKPTALSRCVQIRITEMQTEKVAKLLRSVCKTEGFKVPSEVIEMICNKCGNHVRDCLKMLEQVANAIDSGALDKTKVDVTHVEAHISELLGVPNYELIQGFLSNIYAGRLAQALHIATQCQLAKPLFLKSCLDVHGNVMLALASKKPEDLIHDGYILRYVKPIISGASLSRNTDTIELLQRMSVDMIELYGCTGQFQIGDNMTVLSTIAMKYSPRFKNLTKD